MTTEPNTEQPETRVSDRAADVLREFADRLYAAAAECEAEGCSPIVVGTIRQAAYAAKHIPLVGGHVLHFNLWRK